VFLEKRHMLNYYSGRGLALQSKDLKSQSWPPSTQRMSSIAWVI